MIAEAKPRYWIIENVRGAQWWLGPAKWVRNPVFLWGEFPEFDAEIGPWKERLSSDQVAERAKMPAALSLAVARAIEGSLRFERTAIDVRVGMPHVDFSLEVI